MKRTPNWKDDIVLDFKCGNCAFYQQFIKNGFQTARGHCKRTNKYKQRSDSCLKYSELPKS